MKDHYLSKDSFSLLAGRLFNSSRIIAPLSGFLSEIASADQIDKIDLSGFRTIESFKSKLFKITEAVSEYFGEDAAIKQNKLIFLGARGCDMDALEILDKVYLEGDFKDPYYAAKRDDLLLIGADCTDCGKTCFCTMVGGKPFPVKIFDLNLSPVENGYVVEAGSEKGEWLIEDNKDLFIEASPEQVNEKKRNREKITSRLAEINSEYKIRLDLSETHKRNLGNKAWRTLTKDCVECSACNFACPTCTCFLLLDSKLNTHYARHKIWDACLKAGYARVAGGANSRPKLFERLQNRYHCKFDYSFDRLGRYTCVGCGRCIDACAGNIDMRKIFVELERQVPLTAKLE